MKKAIFVFALFLTFEISVKAQSITEKKIVVFGSSVAAGWVTSYNTQYDFQNGWAYRLERYLKPKGWKVINAGFPGDNTQSALLRIENDLINVKPEIAIISFSLSNEGLTEFNSDAVVDSFLSNLKKIISICKKAEIQPIVGYCYANNDYLPIEYEAIQKANVEISKLNLPTINFLGTFNDENGHFPANHYFDSGHPDNFGHQEMFLGIVPSIFDVLRTNKNSIDSIENNDFIKIGENQEFKSLNFIPEDVIHSFSIYLEVKNSKDFDIDIQKIENTSKISVRNNNLEYVQNNIVSNKIKLQKKNYKLVVTHSYANEKTDIFIDGIKILSVPEKNEPINFVIKSEKTLQCRNLIIYRTCLNSNEIATLQTGNLLNGGLEFYSPLFQTTQNLALSNSVLTTNETEIEIRIKNITEKIEKSNIERNNTPIFVDKIAIQLSTSELQKFAGNYFNEMLGDVIVFVEDNKLFINTMGGNISEILPESQNKFFVKSPYDITITFNSDVNTLELNMMGRTILLNKI